ncbi:sensor histidine kinase [Undibacterium sp. RTI2.1]|uniref:sensor histidine kinase n=1 Tax=Undibacterium sp. RTI2.1 TaxID=3048637 RepID=UPI002B2346CC|nr:sensor histidine kinase [Undibacterium sp. RTI2.1]MEB0029566.1 sensor histidine kinase [Undibacterium sp. RTI2.1]
MLPRLKSLKSRLALWVFLPTVLISAIDLLVTYINTDQVATLVQEQLLKGAAKIISEQISKVDGVYEISVPPAAVELFASKYQDRVLYSVRNNTGVLIAGNPELSVYKATLTTEQAAYFLSTIRGEPVRVIAYSHQLPSSGSKDYVITQVAQTLRGHDAFKSNLFYLTMREHLILLSIVLIGMMIAFRWTLRPLIEFGEKLLLRQPGSLEKLDEKTAPAEIRPVIFATNDYVARLDKTLASYEQFVANTAHQLRTSFAIITSQINYGHRNSHLDQTQKEVLNAIQKTILQGTKVINQLLVLAAVEQNRHANITRKSTQLADLIKNVMEELAPLAQQKNIELGIDVLDDIAIVDAPPYLLRELVSNLIDNAIQHMKTEGTITVSLSQVANEVLLSVIDNGVGIPLTEQQKVFDRFYRLDDSKPNSSGLGLAIVKEIGDSLNATIDLKTPDNGIGLQVDVRFPKSVSSV